MPATSGSGSAARGTRRARSSPGRSRPAWTISPTWSPRSPPSGDRPSATARFDATAIKVVREWDPACPEALLLDARELRKAFLNLIVNAFEALGGSGRLALTASYAADAGTLTVTIEDTGVGMSEETMSRAFDLFYTTKPDGTGLGMSIARSVVQLHGGELTLQSRLGHGTRVQVRLPVVAP